MAKTYSWSEMQSFMKCQRQHELTYHENLQKIPTKASEARIFGTVMHAAMAANLHNQHRPYEQRRKIAANEAHRVIDLETLPNKLLQTANGEVIDTFYYMMMEEMHYFVPVLIEYVLQHIDLDRFYVPKAGEILPLGDWAFCDNCKGSGLVNVASKSCPSCFGIGFDKTYGRMCGCVEAKDCSACAGSGYSTAKAEALMIEWRFEHGYFNGIIDAMLCDRHTQDIILVDWKFRKQFPNSEVAALDGQLPFYAAVLNGMGAQITKTIMWQIRRSVPKPATINQNGMPSIAAQDTTWEYWVETLPSDLRDKLHLNEWRDKLEGKLKDTADYINPIINHVNETSSDLAMDNALAVVRSMEFARKLYEEGHAMPAALNTEACKFCDFFTLCRSPFKWGGDARELIALEYEQRRGREDVTE